MPPPEVFKPTDRWNYCLLQAGKCHRETTQACETDRMVEKKTEHVSLHLGTQEQLAGITVANSFTT